MIINLLILLVSFLVIWTLGFLLHEWCHLFEARRHGMDGWISIGRYMGIPTFSVYFYGETPTSVYYAGGVYSGLIYLLISLIGIPFLYTWGFPIVASLFTVGIVNLFYGIYEGMFIEKLNTDSYIKYHYILYGICILACLIVMWNPLVSYLVG